MHPITQGLPVHPAMRCRLLTRHPFQNERDRQHSPRRRGIPAARRRLPKPRCVQLPTSDRHRAHANTPYLPMRGSNQTTSCRASPRESVPNAAGIIRVLAGGEAGIADAGQPAVAGIGQVAPRGRQGGGRELTLRNLPGLAQIAEPSSSARSSFLKWIGVAFGTLLMQH